MPACTNDLSPLIIALAAQVPILAAALIGYLKIKADNSHSRSRQYEQIKKLDDLTLITKNGFHGPPGETGQTGATGQTGQIGPTGATGQTGPAGKNS